MATEKNSSWESRSWLELKRLALEVPEAGIHLQSKKDTLATRNRPKS